MLRKIAALMTVFVVFASLAGILAANKSSAQSECVQYHIRQNEPNTVDLTVSGLADGWHHMAFGDGSGTDFLIENGVGVTWHSYSIQDARQFVVSVDGCQPVTITFSGSDTGGADASSSEPSEDLQYGPAGGASYCWFAPGEGLPDGFTLNQGEWKYEGGRLQISNVWNAAAVVVYVNSAEQGVVTMHEQNCKFIQTDQIIESGTQVACTVQVYPNGRFNQKRFVVQGLSDGWYGFNFGNGSYTELNIAGGYGETWTDYNTNGPSSYHAAVFQGDREICSADFALSANNPSTQVNNEAERPQPPQAGQENVLVSPNGLKYIYQNGSEIWVNDGSRNLPTTLVGQALQWDEQWIIHFVDQHGNICRGDQMGNIYGCAPTE